MSLMRRRDLLQRSASALLASLGVQAGPSAHAASGSGIDLNRLSVQRGEEGMLLSYDVRIELPDDLEEALGKGIAVVFVAEAALFRERWWWTDEPRGRSMRRWRLAYQPLTRQWRLSQDGLARHHANLQEALDAIRRTEHWRIADTVPPRDDDCHVDFSFKLDTAELPRPLQIGLGGQSEWRMGVERRVAIPAAR